MIANRLSERPGSRKYVGWMVICQDLTAPRDRKVYRAHSRQEAEEAVRTLNARAVREHGLAAPLYFCEWWSTSSSLDGGQDARTLEALCAGAEPDEDRVRDDWTPEEVRRVQELRRDGWGCQRIGIELGRNHSSVGNLLRRLAGESA